MKIIFVDDHGAVDVWNEVAGDGPESAVWVAAKEEVFTPCAICGEVCLVTTPHNDEDGCVYCNKDAFLE